jgi:hypothetical protein
MRIGFKNERGGLTTVDLSSRKPPPGAKRSRNADRADRDGFNGSQKSTSWIMAPMRSQLPRQHPTHIASPAALCYHSTPEFASHLYLGLDRCFCERF